jgi:hypothetical protein
LLSSIRASAKGQPFPLLDPNDAISFTLCVVPDLIFPQHQMYPAWQRLLPGFEWISWRSFALGLVESYSYGWYLVLIWVPLYNLISARQPA